MTNSIDSYVDGALPRLTERRADTPMGKGAQGAEVAPEAREGGNLLELTGNARALKALEQDLAKAPEFDARRVAELKEAVAAGRYQVDAQRVAEKLLAMESKLP